MYCETPRCSRASGDGMAVVNLRMLKANFRPLLSALAAFACAATCTTRDSGRVQLISRLTGGHLGGVVLFVA